MENTYESIKCKSCGNKTLRSYDNSGISTGQVWGDNDFRFDNEIILYCDCGTCGYNQNVRGTITWKVD